LKEPKWKIKVKKILIIFIFGLSILSYGQENSIIEKDSIDGKLLSFGATSKISLNLKIGKLFKERENDSAFYYFNLALNIAKERIETRKRENSK